jgi:hypothetical protein
MTFRHFDKVLNSWPPAGERLRSRQVTPERGFFAGESIGQFANMRRRREFASGKVT